MVTWSLLVQEQYDSEQQLMAGSIEGQASCLHILLLDFLWLTTVGCKMDGNTDCRLIQQGSFYVLKVVSSNMGKILELMFPAWWSHKTCTENDSVYWFSNWAMLKAHLSAMAQLMA